VSEASGGQHCALVAMLRVADCPAAPLFSIKSVIKNKPTVKGRGVELPFNGSRPAPLLVSARTGRCFVRELAYGVRNAAPHRGAVEIILRRKFIGARGAFLEGLLAVPLQHQVGGSPDVDLGYHT